MKIKHFIALAILVIGGGNAWGQTDVTSTYLVNPSFETLKATDGTSDVTVKTTLSKGLFGWEVPSMSNYQVESEASKSSTGFPVDGTGVIVPTDGTYYYFNRQGWSDKNSELKTTTSKEVPAGIYYICFDYKAADYSNNNNAGTNGTTIGIQVKDASSKVVGTTSAVRRAYSIANNGSNPGTDKYMVTAPWTQLGVVVTVEEASVLTIAIQQNMKNSGRSDIVYDNVRMYQLSEGVDITGLIANPSFETGYHANTGWTANNVNDTGVKANSNATYTMSNNHGTYLFNSWGGTAKNYLSQTISNMPSGVYTVKAVVSGFKDEKIVLSAGSGSTYVTPDDKAVGKEISLQFKMLEGDLKIEVSNTKETSADASFIKADNFTLTYDRALTTEEANALKIPTVKSQLKDLLDAFVVPTTNIGTGAFQYPASELESIVSTKQNAQDVYDNAEATYDQVNAQIAIIEALTLPSLNKPADGQRFHLNLKEKGITTFVVKKDAQSGYSITFNDVESNNYAQAFELVPVADATENDMYTMSFTDVAGETRYVCNGIPYGAGTGAYGIRTITDAEKALKVKVVATATEGEYNLLNTSTDGGYKKLGSNGGDFYTDDKYSIFTISEATKASATLKVSAAKYGTFVAPFDAEIPEGVTVYSVSETAGDILTLNEETDGIKANTAYVVSAESEVTENLNGWGLAIKDSYTSGLLTGTYVQIDAPADSYVLQNHGGVVGFYQVDTEVATPKVGANRAYLTAPAASARVLTFDGEETAIKAIDALTSGKAEIFDLNGRRLNSLQKGINVVNGVKILVK